MHTLTSVGPSGYTGEVFRELSEDAHRVVAVAQSAERQIVALEVAGSSPVGHPKHTKVP